MSKPIVFALVNAAQVEIFNKVIMPEMTSVGFFANKKGYNYQIWSQVEAKVVEPGQTPGGYKDGVKFTLPQSDFFSFVNSKPVGIVRDMFFNDLFNMLAKAGHPMEKKMIRDAFHCMSKAIRELVQINEDGSYTLLDGKPGHIPGAKAKSAAQQLAEMQRLMAQQAELIAQLQAKASA